MYPWVDVWRRVSGQIGGRLTLGSSPWSASLEARLAGAPVHATTFMNGELVGMRVTAPAPGAHFIELNVHHGYVYPLGRALGIQDVLVGDAVFDDRFIVKCNDDELARAWLDAESRAAISAASDDYAFAVRDTEVLVTRRSSRPEDDPGMLVAVFEAAARLAGAGGRLVGRWQATAAKLGGTLALATGTWGTGGDLVLELQHPNARIAIDLTFEDLAGRGPPALWTRARAARTSAVQDRWAVHARERRFRAGSRLAEGEPVTEAGFADRWRCLADDPARLAARLTPARRILLKDLAPAAIVGDPGEVSAWLPGFVHDAGRLARLADLVAELALEIDPVQRGPYR